MRPTRLLAVLICFLLTGCAHFAGGDGTAEDPFKAYPRGRTLSAPPATLQVHEKLEQGEGRYFVSVDGHDVPKNAQVLQLAPGEHEIVAARVITERSATYKPFEQEKTDTLRQKFESGKLYYLVIDEQWAEDKFGSRLVTMSFSIKPKQ